SPRKNAENFPRSAVRNSVSMDPHATWSPLEGKRQMVEEFTAWKNAPKASCPVGVCAEWRGGSAGPLARAAASADSGASDTRASDRAAEVVAAVMRSPRG